MTTTPPPSDLAWLLDKFIKNVPETERLIVLSHEGLLIAASQRLAREEAERIAAAASGLKSLAKGTGSELHRGGLRQVMVEYDDGWLFVLDAGANACLAAQATANADVGVLAYELSRLVASVGEFLATSVRSAA